MFKKIIVVGASGYVGGRIYDKAQSLPFDAVIGTATTASGNLTQLQLNRHEEFDYALIDKDTIVLLLAAISSPDICANEHEYAWAVNVAGTMAFIKEVIARAGRVVFFSSDTVYGQQEALFDERMPPNPVGEYAIMKQEVEKEFANIGAFKTVRLSHVFSLENKFSRYLVSCATEEKPAEVFHPFYRSVIYIDDVVEGALNIVKNWPQIPEAVINFGGPQVVSRIEFAKCLQKEGLSRLRWQVKKPDAAFFKNRPKSIAMMSPILEKLLGRKPRSLFEAANLEFQTSV